MTDTAKGHASRRSRVKYLQNHALKRDAVTAELPQLSFKVISNPAINESESKMIWRRIMKMGNSKSTSRSCSPLQNPKFGQMKT